MAVQTTQEKFVHEMGDIYDAESVFLEDMEQLVQQASDPTLHSLIQDNIGQTQQQLKNLDQAFTLLGSRPKQRRSDAAAGLVAEAQRIVREAGTPVIRDCMIGDMAAKNQQLRDCRLSHADRERGSARAKAGHASPQAKPPTSGADGATYRADGAATSQEGIASRTQIARLPMAAQVAE
jgi:hypothetical protein